MTEQKTPTPRTDAEVADLAGMRERSEMYTEPVSSAFARQLETDLQAMTAELTAALAAIQRRDEVIDVAKDALRMIEHWDDDCPYDDPGQCANEAFLKMNVVELSVK